MFRSLVSILLLTVSVTACGRENAPAPQPATQTPQETSATPPASATAQTAETRQATAAQESVSDDTPDRADVALERLAAVPANQQLPDGKWRLGTNYKPLVPPQPTNVSAGKVEVVEVFWYGCPHCSVLEPYLANWEEKSKPEYVEFVRVPVIWGPAHRAHAKLFYTLEALGRPDLHKAVFAAIHQENNMLLGKTDAETLNLQSAFVAAHGIDSKKFTDAFNSFSVASHLQRAEQLTQRYRVRGVPQLVINGKYVTDVSDAGGPSQLIELVNDLAASERRR